MAISFALMLPVLCGFCIAALVLSRQVLERRELQSATDALALAAAHSLEQRGTPLETNTAIPMSPLNARLQVTPSFSPPDRRFDKALYPGQNRALVRVQASSFFDTQQSWFSRHILRLDAVSYAQVNENVFGDTWPTLVFVVDASESMNLPILGSSSIAAFTVVAELITSYASNTLPVRNGVITFEDDVLLLASARPPPDNTNNLASIRQAFSHVVLPEGKSNMPSAFVQARDWLRDTPGGRNVVFVTDGEPTAGGSCPAGAVGGCFFAASVQAAAQVRMLPSPEALEQPRLNGVALFTLEIRRHNWWQTVTDFLHQIAGEPMSQAGNNDSMAFMAQSQLGISQFITGLTRSICSFGPLTPRPGSGTDAWRPRPSNPTPAAAPRRVYAFIREPPPSELEHPIGIWDSRDEHPFDQGFEYVTDAQGEAFIVLTLASCNALGADSGRRLVVRWDDPQLVPKPGP